MSIFIIKNAMLSHHNFVLVIDVHMNCNQVGEKLNNKFSLLQKIQKLRQESLILLLKSIKQWVKLTPDHKLGKSITVLRIEISILVVEQELEVERRK